MSEFEIKTYYAIALDPIHVGAGGARLERVDLPIIREPGTNLPKIPGTSLSGPARTYTAMQTNRYRWKKNGEEYSCAGRGGEGGEKHCGSVNPACPVCVPYGFSKGSGNSMQGLAQFFDAQILLFPVASLAGTVWVTSPMVLEGLGLNSKFQARDDGFYPMGDRLKDRDKAFNGGRNDEGAWTCTLTNEEAVEVVAEACEEASNELGFTVRAGLDVAASTLWNPKKGEFTSKFMLKSRPEHQLNIISRFFRINHSIKL